MPATADTVDPASTTPTTTTTTATSTTTTTLVPATDPSAAVPPPTDLAEATVVSRVATGSRLAVGDSILVGATPLMRRHGFAIHAKVGRQFSTAPGIVRAFGGALPRNVVIELGTNGTVSLATCRAVVRAAGPHRRVFLVTNRVPRSWEDSNNATLRACDASFRASRVRLVDWHAASAGRADWFAADGIHPSAAGRAAFTRLVDRAVDRYGL
ncbi:MAG TPA: hypothetical protein VF143_07975 [Candidatus Nanopelagicales bacterium]